MASTTNTDTQPSPFPVRIKVNPGNVRHPNLGDGIGLCCAFIGVGPLTVICTLAMGIISALGIAGILPGATVGALLITSGSLAFVASLLLYSLGEDRKEKILGIVGAIAGLALIIIGALGYTHILSGFAVGLVGIVSSVLVIGGAAVYYKKFFQKKS